MRKMLKKLGIVIPSAVLTLLMAVGFSTPAFAYVEELMEKREFENLKGLVYFTDGYGLFPAKMPPYRTAFVFMEQEPEDVDIPAWAMKLVITEEEL